MTKKVGRYELGRTLGEGTFAPGPLAMTAVEDGVASVPGDGWTQMIVYRADKFAEAGLEAPTSYANVVAALVIRIGRKRAGPACRIARFGSQPSSRTFWTA